MVMSLGEARLCRYTSSLVSVLEVCFSKMLEFLLASTITIYERKVLNYMTNHWESGKKEKLAYVRVEKQHGAKVSVTGGIPGS